MKMERKPQYPMPEPRLKFATDFLILSGAVTSMVGIYRGLIEDDFERVVASSICSGLVLVGSIGLEINRRRRRNLMFKTDSK